MTTDVATVEPALRPRDDRALAGRLARSAAVTGEGAALRTDEVAGWLARRGQAHAYAVRQIPFTGLDGWHFTRDTGDLVHRSGGFFSVAGLRVAGDDAPYGGWDQPVIHQPQAGILGILAKEFDGVLHFLMQAKMEPGNPRLIQLAPTVQATRSNWTRLHHGAPVRHLDAFLRPPPGRVLADVLQSEHGSWFYRKSNRNMIVETRGPVPESEDFRWLTLGQLGELLRRDDLVNMDARTVLSCAPVPYRPDGGAALSSDTEALSWLAGERAANDVRARLVPLNEVRGWRRGPWSVEHEQGRYFRVVAVSVTAGGREVPAWTQPLLAPCGEGVTAFLTRTIGGVPHLLVRASVEGGLRLTAELGPTVDCVPANHAHLPPGRRPPFLDAVLSAPAHRVRYAAVHSEEGGRFLSARSRCLFVEAGDEAPATGLPPGFAWLTPAQLGGLVRYGHYLTVQARTLLALLGTGAVRLGGPDPDPVPPLVSGGHP